MKTEMEVKMTLTEDDMEDILEAIRRYADDLVFEDDGSQYVEAVLDNLESLRDRIYAARRENMQ